MPCRAHSTARQRVSASTPALLTQYAVWRGTPTPPPHRPDVDDLAAPAGDHRRRHRPRAPEHRREVGVERERPVGVGQLHGLLLEQDARVVDQDVDRTSRLFHRPHAGDDVVSARHVEPERAGVAAVIPYASRRRLQLVRRPRRTGHRRPGIPQRERDPAADPPAGAGDQHDAPGERVPGSRRRDVCRAGRHGALSLLFRVSTAGSRGPSARGPRRSS